MFVTIQDQFLSVCNDGGLNIDFNKQYNKYNPTIIFSEFRTSTNFV